MNTGVSGSVLRGSPIRREISTDREKPLDVDRRRCRRDADGCTNDL